MGSTRSALPVAETSPWVDEATAGTYALLMHLNSFMNAVSTGLAVYLIVWKSPAAMGNYKWFLLNMTVGTDQAVPGTFPKARRWIEIGLERISLGKP